ncbi:precorrin-3B synthase [Devosia sp. PTR5]|uniref:Precorrin-3B synthase n=1 Tax=Devosia oryzisoli TaxID=2774138 RepID=A0A927FTY7_9HYPH|nr:precorrin-3B synthase [Devosia oryzisoli]
MDDQSSSVTATITPSRRGACPTLDAPMQTGDGLLARLRIPGNRLSPAQLRDVATLAIACGNGLVEVTARGNLQLRGLTQQSAPLFAATIRQSLPIESGLVVDLSPLAGDDPQEIADPRPLAQAIRDGAAPLADQLGPKVSVVIDGSGQISLAPLKADIRLLALGSDRWLVSLGGSKPQTMDQPTAIATTLATLSALAALGPDARATDLFPASSPGAPHPTPPHQGEGAEPVTTPDRATPPTPPLPPRGGGREGGSPTLEPRNGPTPPPTLPLPPLDGEGPREGWSPTLQTLNGHTTPLTLPFGQMPGTALIALADRATQSGLTTIRLAPDHTLLLDNATADLITDVAALGFITDPADPRRRVSACIGSDGCASGHIAARRIAAALAPHLPPGQHLHVSGCPKGCAHPRPADVTLVGRPGEIGLVIGGRAGDTPQAILDEAGLVPALTARQDAR